MGAARRRLGAVGLVERPEPPDGGEEQSAREGDREGRPGGHDVHGVSFRPSRPGQRPACPPAGRCSARITRTPEGRLQVTAMAPAFIWRARGVYRSQPNGRPARHLPAECNTGMATGRSKPHRQQNRTQWGGRPPKGWLPLDAGTPLQVLLKKRMTELGQEGPPLSTHEVSARSKGLVSANTVSALVRGKVTDPRPQTVEALAIALAVSEDRVRRAAAASQRQGARKPDNTMKALLAEMEKQTELLRQILRALPGR